MLSALRQSLHKTVQRRGFWGTPPWILRQLYKRARDLAPDRRRLHAAREAADRHFDARYHVDTAGVIPLYHLTIPSENWIYGGRYQAILPEEFHPLLHAAGEIAPGTVFVDFGSGKGRALLLAAEYPFTRIVGVEFSPDLVAIARKNCLSYQDPAQVCRDIESVVCDAANYLLPEEPLVLMLFNPFEYHVMAKVADNVRDSLERHPRPVTVIVSNPNQNRDPRVFALWDGIPGLRRKVSNPVYVIYSS